MKHRESTHAEVCRYYRTLGLMADDDPNETQHALNVANAAALGVRHVASDKPRAKRKGLEKGSKAAKHRMAELRSKRKAK